MKKLNAMCKKVQSKLGNQKGATMVEYALMVALIAVVCILAVTDVGTKARDAFQGVADSIPAVPAAQ